MSRKILIPTLAMAIALNPLLPGLVGVVEAAPSKKTSATRKTQKADLDRITEKDLCKLEEIDIDKLPQLIDAYRNVCEEKGSIAMKRVTDMDMLRQDKDLDCYLEGRRLGQCLARVQVEVEQVIAEAKRTENCDNCAANAELLLQTKEKFAADEALLLEIADQASCSGADRKKAEEGMAAFWNKKFSCWKDAFNPAIWLSSRTDSGYKAKDAGKKCGSDCLTEIVASALKSVRDLAEGVKMLAFDLPVGLAMAGWAKLRGVEDMTSQAAHIASTMSADQLKEYKKNQMGFFEGIKDDIDTAMREVVGCQEWSGPRFEAGSKCVKPSTAWSCTPADQRLAQICGAVAYIGADLLVSSFTFGFGKGAFMARLAPKLAKAKPGLIKAAEAFNKASGGLAGRGAGTAGRGLAKSASEVAEASVRTWNKIPPTTRANLTNMAKASFSSDKAVLTAAKADMGVAGKVVVGVTRTVTSPVRLYFTADDSVFKYGDRFATKLLGGKTASTAASKTAASGAARAANKAVDGAEPLADDVVAEVADKVRLQAYGDDAVRSPASETLEVRFRQEIDGLGKDPEEIAKRIGDNLNAQVRVENSSKLAKADNVAGKADDGVIFRKTDDGAHQADNVDMGPGCGKANFIVKPID